MDDQLSGRRFVPAFEVKFMNPEIAHLLRLAQKTEEFTQQERSILNRLNKEALEKKGENPDSMIQPFDSKLGLKLFTLTLTGTGNSQSRGVSLPTPMSTNANNVAEQSLSDILSEEPWKGRRIYKMRLMKRSRQMSSRNSQLSGLLSNSECRTFNLADNSIYFEMDMQTHSLCGEKVQVLQMRSLPSYSMRQTAVADENWLDMISSKFLEPTQEILRLVETTAQAACDSGLPDQAND